MPATVFEKLENCESKFKTIVHDQVLKELRIHYHSREGPQKPLVIEDSLLNITRHRVVIHKEGFIVGVDLVGSTPLDNRDILSILWRVKCVHVECFVISFKLSITVGKLGLSTLTFNSVDHFENSVITRLSKHLIVGVTFLLQLVIVILVA